MLDRYRGSERRRRTVDLIGYVEPIPIDGTRR
jgi:hypothetical protein